MTLKHSYFSKTSLSLLPILLFCNIATADDLLNRLENATELLAKNQETFYVSRVPELKGKLPSSAVDDETRGAISCVLNGIKSSKGDTAAEEYVKYVEKSASKDFTSFSQLSEVEALPTSLDEDTLISLMTECKNIEISTKRLQESGAWEILSNPETMKKLMAE